MPSQVGNLIMTDRTVYPSIVDENASMFSGLMGADAGKEAEKKQKLEVFLRFVLRKNLDP